jgi:glycosyltransferase involved in cell wall biosynthesis
MLISVIIPTYNKKKFLLRALSFLDKQTLPKNLYEVLLIDDGSCYDVEKYVRPYITEGTIRYFKKIHGGPGSARNLGIKHAKGDIVAFTDDDCIIPSDWLKNIHDSFLYNDKMAGIEGKTISFIDEIHPLSHQVINAHPQGVFPTCNMSYRKQILERIGGFYYKFTHPHDEDIDLAWNALKYGDVVFNDSVVIMHPVYYKNIFKKLLWTCYFKDEFILYNRHRELYKKLRGGNPWLFIYFRFYTKHNYFFLLRKYIKNKKLNIFSLLSIEIIIFLLLQGLLLFFLAFFFIYRHNEK